MPFGVVVPRSKNETNLPLFLIPESSSVEVSLTDIAKILDKKDHTTIMHGVNKIEEQLKTNPDLVSQIDIIKKKINPI